MTSATADTTFNGELYTYGTLGQIGGLSESESEGGTSLTFSALDPAVLAALAAGGFLNAPVTIHVSPVDFFVPVSFDSDAFKFDSTLITFDSARGAGIAYFDGFATGLNIGIGSDSSSITLACSSKSQTIARPRSARYSDQEQQRNHPGDKGMEYASVIASKEVIWPARAWFENQ
tara:strand:- start:2136 stop:2660 length:525 start_codon:yes stop_codon:yes gene_type:complete